MKEKKTLVVFDDEVVGVMMTPRLAEELARRSGRTVLVAQPFRFWRRRR